MWVSQGPVSGTVCEGGWGGRVSLRKVVLGSHIAGEPTVEQDHPWVGRKLSEEGLSPLQGTDGRHFYLRSEAGLCPR